MIDPNQYIVLKAAGKITLIKTAPGVFAANLKQYDQNLGTVLPDYVDGFTLADVQTIKTNLQTQVTNLQTLITDLQAL